MMTDQSGPDHRKSFRIEVRVSDGAGGTIKLAEAEGTTKKQAQQEAARSALASLLSGGLRGVAPKRETAHAAVVSRKPALALPPRFCRDPAVETAGDSARSAANRVLHRLCLPRRPSRRDRLVLRGQGQANPAVHPHGFVQAFQSLLTIIVIALFIITSRCSRSAFRRNRWSRRCWWATSCWSIRKFPATHTSR